ncbi:hypothetical protein BFRIG_00197 [Peribacillus frigoritolerans]
MEVFAEFLANIDNPQHRERTEEVLAWVTKKFPHLMPKIAWNQPMFTDHDTYIIGFSVAKHHLAVAPERQGSIISLMKSCRLAMITPSSWYVSSGTVRLITHYLRK